MLPAVDPVIISKIWVSRLERLEYVCGVLWRPFPLTIGVILTGVGYQRTIVLNVLKSIVVVIEVTSVTYNEQIITKFDLHRLSSAFLDIAFKTTFFEKYKCFWFLLSKLDLRRTKPVGADFPSETSRAGRPRGRRPMTNYHMDWKTWVIMFFLPEMRNIYQK